MSGKALRLNIDYPYIWVNSSEDADESEYFCILVDGEWHEAQSIDFNF